MSAAVFNFSRQKLFSFPECIYRIHNYLLLSYIELFPPGKQLNFFARKFIFVHVKQKRRERLVQRIAQALQSIQLWHCAARKSWMEHTVRYSRHVAQFVFRPALFFTPNAYFVVQFLWIQHSIPPLYIVYFNKSGIISTYAVHDFHIYGNTRKAPP